MTIEKVENIIEILKYINSKGECTIDDLATNFEVALSTLYRYVDEWHDQEIVKKVELSNSSKHQHRFKIVPLAKIKQYITKISNNRNYNREVFQAISLAHFIEEVSEKVKPILNILVEKISNRKSKNKSVNATLSSIKKVLRDTYNLHSQK